MILGKLYNFLVYWVLGFYTFNHLISNPGINFWNGLSFFSLKRVVIFFISLSGKQLGRKQLKLCFDISVHFFWNIHYCCDDQVDNTGYFHRIGLQYSAHFREKWMTKLPLFSEVSLDNMELGRSSKNKNWCETFKDQSNLI